MTDHPQKELTGILFPNDKGNNEKRPDWRGDATIGGVRYRVSGWIKQGKKGQFISLAFTPPQQDAKAEDQW